MNSVTVNPIIPIPKRTSGFSIASILTRDVGEHHSASSGEDSDHGEDNSGQTLSNDDMPCFSHGQRIPPLHPTLPLHVQQLLLQDITGKIKPEVLALRPQAVTFGNQFGQFFGGLVPNDTVRPGFPQYIPTQSFFQEGMQIYPGLLASSVASSGRNSLAMYQPWMMNKPGADVLGYPFGNPEARLFFHPYRKPKRIRTAFSPSQLLKLEHAFENNHYVVGQERKELASKLNLSETQVKVWFQNRRTKHKRVKSDDECDNGDISVDDDDVVASSSMTDTYNDHIEISSDNR